MSKEPLTVEGKVILNDQRDEFFLLTPEGERYKIHNSLVNEFDLLSIFERTNDVFAKASVKKVKYYHKDDSWEMRPRLYELKLWKQTQ